MCASSSAVVSLSKVSWLAARPNKPNSPSCRIVSSRSATANQRPRAAAQATAAVAGTRGLTSVCRDPPLTDDGERLPGAAT
jgi:hypothetical protein